MKNFNINFVNSNNFKIIVIFSSILIFTLPIIFYGIMDLEDYNYGFFSSYIIFKNNLNPFIFFSDKIGPGINFPMSSGIFFHPFLILFDNTRLFYFLIITLHLSLQSFYFIKINKLFNIKDYVVLFIPLIIFSNTNFNYHYSDDWITASFCFSFVFVVTYYFLKILKKNSIKDYIKFSIFFFLFVENGHIGYIFFCCIFLITLFIFSQNKLLIIKNYKPYLFLIVVFLLLLEKIIYFSDIFLYFHSNKEIQSGFYNYDNNLNDIIKTIFPFFGEYFRSINRLSSNPFIIIAAFLFIVFLKKDKIFVNLKYIFFLIIIFNFTSVLKIFDLVLTGTWWIRDFTLIISCLLCLQYFGQIQNHLKIIMIVLLFSYSGLYYVKNFFGIMNNTNNFIVNKPKNLSMINFFKDLNIEEKFNRVYLSPKSFELLNQNNSSKYGIYSEKDLIKFNLSPFNANFKNNKTSLFFKQKNQKQYYTQITPRIDDLNNLFFLSLFNINYSFVSEKELNLIDKNNYEIISILNLPKQKFYFIKNKISLLAIKDPKNLKEIIDKCKDHLLSCLENEEKLFIKVNGKFSKIKNFSYNIDMNDNIKYYPVLPFVFDKNWQCNKKKCFQINNFLMFSKVNNDGRVSINYHDKIRFFSRSLSLTILLCLFLVLIFKSNQIKLR